MDVLNKMLVRELQKSKGQFIAAAAVVFAGIVLFSASFMSYKNLNNSVKFYYDKYKFLNYYAQVNNVTPNGIKKIKEVRGVKDSIGRICMNVGADLGEDKRVTVRLISVPDNERPQINDLIIYSGSYLDKGTDNACLLNSKFANFHKLKIGDDFKVIINLKKYSFKVQGITDSPEFIYAMKSEASVSPSPDKFGIMYIKESAAKSILGLNEIYNEVHVIFEEDYDEDKVIDKIQDELEPYGFIRGIKRKDQLSNTMVNNEINELRRMALMFPILFLSAAAMIICIMMRRIISNQRTVIGVLKAFGYTNARIFLHYVIFSLIIAVCGALPAVFCGLYLGTFITALYNSIFNIPIMKIKIYWDILIFGVLLSVSFCIIAGGNSAKQVMAIKPAEAMRTEAPKVGKRILLENVKFIWSRVSFGWKMSIRNVFRNPQRAGSTILGISVTIMFFMVSLFFMDSINYILDKNFNEFQQQDYKVMFSKPAAFSDASELTSIDGIKKSEPFIEIPAEIINGWKKEDTIIVGLEGTSSLYKLVDDRKATVSIPDNGILIAQSIAQKLSIKCGQWITIKPYIGDMRKINVKVAGLVKQYAGFNCFMNIKELGFGMQEGIFANGALLKIEGLGSDIKKELFKISGIESVEARAETLRDFMQFTKLMYTFIGAMIVFGAMMGFAIIFNTTVINIMERRRELASLKVLGYTSKEIENTILRENFIIGMLSLMPGLVLGQIMCRVFARQFSNELFALEVVIYPRTYIITFASVILFLFMAQWANRKSITGLDMVDVLKNREG